MTNRNNESDISADVCIIGGAGAGLTAAVRAAESGVSKILVIDKSKIMGGCTRMAQGLFSVESPAQKRLGIKYSADDCFVHHMDMSNWECDARLVRNWMCVTGNVIQWLEEKGLYFKKVVTFSGTMRSYHMTDKPTGNEIVKTLLKICKQKGVELLTNTRATKLLTDEDGSVTGVLAAQGDRMLKISAKGVIIATGSISANKELIARFYPGADFNEVKIMANVPHNTGDGLIMAEEIGAASTYISSLFIGPHNHPNNPRTALMIRRPHLIKINKDGERFVDEAIPLTRNWGWMMAVALDRQPGKFCYAVMDEKILRDALENKQNLSALEFVHGSNENDDITSDYGMENATELNPNNPTAWLDRLEEDIRSEVEAGRVKIANTLEEAAEWMDVDADVFKATIAGYNAFCEKKYDADFLKDPQYLFPISTPPYYIFKAYQGLDTCIGGLRINHRLQVLNKKLKPIKGLYAAGVVAGGWLAHNYSFFGSEMSFTTFSGYTAGEIVAEYVNKEVT